LLDIKKRGKKEYTEAASFVVMHNDLNLTYNQDFEGLNHRYNISLDPR
jgi:hypothetical protein